MWFSQGSITHWKRSWHLCGCLVLRRAHWTLHPDMIDYSIRKGSVKRSWCFPLFGQEVQFFLFRWNTMDTAINEQAQSLVWCTWEQTKYFSLYSIYNDKCFLFPVTCRECQQSCSCYLKEKMSKNVTVFSRSGEKNNQKQMKTTMPEQSVLILGQLNWSVVQPGGVLAFLLSFWKTKPEAELK